MKKMKSLITTIKLISIICFALVVSNSCTKEISGNLPDPTIKLVVDGNIEINTPPIILLTRSTKVFGDLNINDLASFFEHNAEIWVTDVNSGDSVLLVEYCLRDLPFPDSVKAELLKGVGILAFDSNSVPNICIYTVPDIVDYFFNGTCDFYGKEEHVYNLSIKSGARFISSSTSIPKARPVNYLAIRPHSNPQNDTLVNVMVNLTTPDNVGNFLRYWTKRNDQPFYPPLSQSVYDDKLFRGNIELPLERGQPQSASQGDDPTYGYFWKGDTVTLKWATIDYKTYDFFYTLENDGTGNPFANQVRVKSNIVGGLGVFAGYGTTYASIVIPR